MLPASEKITLVLEGIGDDKIRVNSSSLDHALSEGGLGRGLERCHMGRRLIDFR